MTYLIKGAREANGESKDLLIHGCKVAYKAKSLNRLKHVQMNCGGFLITPGRVMIDFSILQESDFSLYKKRMIELERLGCTTVLVVCEVTCEEKLLQQLKKARHHMINSSIDYVIGISVPLKKLTSTLVRRCKREKIPFIFTSVESELDFDTVKWAWIREALFPYRMAIVPDWNAFGGTKREMIKLQRKWYDLATAHDISTFDLLPENETILTKPALRKIGISPLKGELYRGGDLDYNLYGNGSLDDCVHLHYDKNSIPDVVVLRGKVMKAGRTVYYRPGFGNEISVRTPGLLTTY